MKLYFAPQTGSLAAIICLAEAGLDYEPVKVSLKDKTLLDGGDYRKVNPLGYVPFLVLDDGTGMAENAAILQYIADQVPAKKLAPPNGDLLRYQLQSWLSFTATELHKNLKSFFNPHATEAAKDAARNMLTNRFTWVDSELSERDYVVGDAFSVADAYLFVIASGASGAGLDLSGMKNVAAFRERVGQRESVKAALDKEKSA